jgi:D-proline reductase (dithiol) PrdB
LIQGALEGRGIATTSVSICEEITRKVSPPRALFAPYPFGYPLGRPRDAALQLRIIRRALELLQSGGPPPVYASFDPDAAGDEGGRPARGS